MKRTIEVGLRHSLPGGREWLVLFPGSMLGGADFVLVELSVVLRAIFKFLPRSVLVVVQDLVSVLEGGADGF